MNNDNDNDNVSDDFGLWSRVNRLLQTYADCMDRADCVGIAQLFSPDGCWDFAPGQQFRGRPAILEALHQGIGRFARTHHQVGTPVLSRDSEGQLQSQAYFMAVHLMADGSRYTVWGRYRDTLGPAAAPLILHRQVIAHLSDGATRPYRMLERLGTSA